MPISRAGGGYGPAASPPPTTYTTTFADTEANVSQSGNWVGGNNSGSNPTTGPQSTGGTPGVAYSHAADACDYVALYAGSSPSIDPTSQYVELTIKRTGGYVAPDTQECEGFLFGAITAGVVKGYEFDIYFAGTLLQPVRWDDSSIGDYDFSAVTAVAGEDPNAWPGNLGDGDVVKIVGKIVGGDPKFWVYVNGGLVRVLHDTTAGKITSGLPGFAFFVRTGGGVDLMGFALKGVKVGTAT